MVAATDQHISQSMQQADGRTSYPRLHEQLDVLPRLLQILRFGRPPVYIGNVRLELCGISVESVAPLLNIDRLSE